MKEDKRGSAAKRVSAGRWLAGFLTAIALVAGFTAAALVLGGVGPAGAAVSGSPTTMEMSVTDVHGERLEFEILSFSWGAIQGDPGVGGDPGRVDVSSLSVTKWVDSASASLHSVCCEGDHFSESTLTIQKAGGTPRDYFVITMTDVQITSVGTSGSGEDPLPTESYSFVYGRIEFEYTPQKEGGGGSVEYDCWGFPECTKG